MGPRSFLCQESLYGRARPHLLWVLSKIEEDIEARARFYLMLGGAAEFTKDYPAAVDYYAQAWALEPAEPLTWYYVNNNLGFSLNTLGRFEEGERFCRIAIDADPDRYNAWKNLGISRAGQGDLVDAARCLIRATHAYPLDRRAFDLLVKLVAEHPEIVAAVPELERDIEHYRTGSTGSWLAYASTRGGKTPYIRFTPHPN